MALSISGMALTIVMDATVIIPTGISLVCYYEIGKVGGHINFTSVVR